MPFFSALPVFLLFPEGVPQGEGRTRPPFPFGVPQEKNGRILVPSPKGKEGRLFCYGPLRGKASQPEGVEKLFFSSLLKKRSASSFFPFFFSFPLPFGDGKEGKKGCRKGIKGQTEVLSFWKRREKDQRKTCFLKTRAVPFPFGDKG